MNGFPWFSKSFGPGDTEIFEIDGRKTCATSRDGEQIIEIILVPTLSILKIGNFSYTVTVTFLCWSFSFTYWKIKWVKN
jgi:hypothetical protein